MHRTWKLALHISVTFCSFETIATRLLLPQHLHPPCPLLLLPTLNTPPPAPRRSPRLLFKAVDPRVPTQGPSFPSPSLPPRRKSPSLTRWMIFAISFTPRSPLKTRPGFCLPRPGASSTFLPCPRMVVGTSTSLRSSLACSLL